MAIREGKWKCRHCGGVSRGSQLHCASCGVKRGEDVRFFLEDDAPEVTDAALLAKARGGARPREVRAAGDDATPRWPELALRPGEREASRSETCVVLLQGRKTYRMKQPCDGLARFEVGRSHHAVVRGGVSVVELK